MSRRLSATVIARGAPARPAAIATVRRRLVWMGALLLAFAVPYAVNATRGEPAPAVPAALEPPARAAAPAPAPLRKAAALPRLPKPRSRPPAVPSAPPAAVAPVQVPPATVAPAPAPAPAASPPARETFDLEG